MQDKNVTKYLLKRFIVDTKEDNMQRFSTNVVKIFFLYKYFQVANN